MRGFLVLTAVIAASASSVFATNIPVSNGSFEVVGSVTDGNWNGLPIPSASSEWVDGTGAYSGYQIDRVGDNFSNANAPASGVKYLNLGAVTPLSQDLATSVVAGQVITMDFDAGHAQNFAAGTLTANLLVDNVVIGSKTVDLSTAAPGVWNPEEFSGIATAPGDLSIQFVNNGGTNWIDNVTVSTPEPASVGIVSLATLTLLRRFRRR